MKKICSIFFISVFIFLAIPNAVLGADRQKAVMLKEQGNKAMVAGDDKKAVDLYIKSIKADPSYANSYNNIGMILDKKGDKEFGKSCFDRHGGKGCPVENHSRKSSVRSQ